MSLLKRGSACVSRSNAVLEIGLAVNVSNHVRVSIAERFRM